MTLFLTLQGFSYVDYYNGGYENADSLSSLVKTGANAIEAAFEYGINPKTDAVYADSNYTDSLTAIGATIKEAVGDGLSVMVRPLIDFLNPADLTGTPYSVGDWRSYFNPGAAGSGGADAFFASYKTMLLQYAQVGAANGATSLCIGTELDQLTGPAYKSYWDDIISTLRTDYPTLKLTYAADWDDDLSPWTFGGSGLKAGTGNLATQVSFASELDYIGIDDYAPISDAANPTLAQLIAGWNQTPTDATSLSVTGGQSLISYFESVAAAVGKPLIFTELGYESATDAASSPAGSSTNKYDPALQSLLYQAFFDAWQQSGNASLTGVYFWNWDPNAAEVGPGHGANFSPQGLPTQTEVTQAFSSSDQLQLAQVFGPQSTLEIDITTSGSVVKVFDNVSGGETEVDIPGYQIGDSQIVTGDTGTPYVLNLSAGVVVDGLTVSAGGVLNGPGELLGSNAIFGTENGIVVGGGGTETVYAGALASGSTILSGGREVVSSGGSSVSAQIAGGGALQVCSGGRGLNTSIFDGGVETLSGGTASGASVGSGGVLRVSSGGVASVTMVFRGGEDGVFVGGVAHGTFLSGGAEYDYAMTSGTEVASGGHEVVETHGTAWRAVVGSGGLLTVSSGGTLAGGLRLWGGKAVISGTMAAGQTVSFAGSSAVLELDNLEGFAANISGMSRATQQVDLGGFAFTSGESATWAPSGTSGTLTVTDGAKTAHLTLIGTYASGDFQLGADGHGGTIVDDPPRKPAVAAGFAQAMAALAGDDTAYVHAGGEATVITTPRFLTAVTSGR